MGYQGTFEVEGEVVERLPNTLFRVKIEKTSLEELQEKVSS